MLWFNTPCWGRPELTNVVLAQRRLLCDALGANCVVVADDENLEVARKYGFPTVKQENHPMGRKLNDGFQYAVEHGASHVCQLDSDSWARPEHFLNLLPDTVISSCDLGIVSEDGRTLARLLVKNNNNPFGAGPFVVPVSLVPKRPLDENTLSGWDRGLIEAYNLPVVYRHAHKWPEVAFKTGSSLDGFKCLLPLAKDLYEPPWPELAQHFSADLVSAIRGFYDRHKEA